MANSFDSQSAVALAGLALGALRVSARRLSDRADEMLGRALPRTPEALAQPAVLNALLRDHAPPGARPLPEVIRARLPGVRFESSNCQNFLIELEFAADQDADGQPLPRSLYAKIPCDDFATGLFANAVGFWAIECAFCERVASRVPVRVPRVYAVAERGARFVLLMENLREDPSAQLFTNRDMAAGTSLERAQRCLETFAEFHAHFHGWSAGERAALLPAASGGRSGLGDHASMRAMHAAAIGRAHRAAPEAFTSRHVELCRLALEKWDPLVAYWYAEPLTLMHGDSHLGNCFDYREHDELRAGMIDFQGLQWGCGLRDVQYFSILSLDSELLASHEGELIEHYRKSLALHGVELDAARAFEQYRAFSFQSLMAGVVPLGMGALTERQTTLTTVLQRATAAVDRLGLRDWLETL